MIGDEPVGPVRRVRAPHARLRRIRARIEQDESGLALVWMTLFLMVLIGFAALAVDIGHGYFVAQHAQNAADAAALGGTVYLPDDVTAAQAEAVTIAKANGFEDGKDGVTVKSVQQPQPTQLKVTVSQDVPTWFAKALGFDTMHISRTATADYDQPVAMGSPANTFGNQPDCAVPCTAPGGNPTPQFWANIAGGASPKGNGDRFQAGLCQYPGSPPTGQFDNCAAGGTNDDYKTDGYIFAVNNSSTTATKLTIDAFDPAFVHVGDTCNDGTLKALYNDLQAAGQPASVYARYQPGNTQWCTGDQYFASGTTSDGVKHPPFTSFRVYEPDTTPFTVADNIEITQCRHDFQGTVGDLDAEYNADVAAGRGPVVDWFRKWVNLCTIPNPVKGSYLVQVRTDVQSDGTVVTAGGGHNRYSVRAALDDNLASSGISIYGQGYMGVYANAPGAATSFYLARILPGAAGRHLTLTFFDTGDASDPGTLQVLPPADARDASGSTISFFDKCQYTPPPGNAAWPPAGSLTDTESDCKVSGVSNKAGWDGQIVDWVVPIPDGYTCDFTLPTGCWLSLSFSFPGASSVTDTTSWAASLDGNPVRIVQ
jgi:Flp pilus assembly protein TadG